MGGHVVKLRHDVTIRKTHPGVLLRESGSWRNLDAMSTQARNDSIPEWTRGDRLRKARSLTGLTSREFAEEIGVSQKAHQQVGT